MCIRDRPHTAPMYASSARKTHIRWTLPQSAPRAPQTRDLKQDRARKVSVTAFQVLEAMIHIHPSAPNVHWIHSPLVAFPTQINAQHALPVPTSRVRPCRVLPLHTASVSPDMKTRDRTRWPHVPRALTVSIAWADKTKHVNFAALAV